MKKRKPGMIVLDKNYLQSAPGSEIRDICARGAAMSDTLFYELLSNPVNRDKCFKKLPAGENPLVLLPGLGDLLRMEVKNNRPCGRPSKHVEPMRYQFNAKLADGTFVFTAEQQAHLDNEMADVANQVKGVPRMVEATATMFPALLGGEDESRQLLKVEIERTIGEDRDLLVKFFDSIRPPAIHGKEFPHPSRLTPNWAIYRWLQLRLLLGIDLLYRYKLGLKPLIEHGGSIVKTLENHLHDSNHLLFGSLEGALASRDKNVRRLWRVIGAKGDLIPATLPTDTP